MTASTVLPPLPEAPAGERPIATAYYVGTQRGYGIVPDFALWTLTVDIPGHPAGSTVTPETIAALGYDLQPAPWPPETSA